MTSHDCDILVIGGGIHGAGAAQAAAAGGFSVALLEQTQLAAGTSSRSSKLIHGGLRYLESGQFHLVRESLREREILLRVASGLVRLVPFHIPVYADSRRGAWTIRAGLTLYAVLGGLARHSRFSSLPPDLWGDLDGLRTDGLRAVFRYRDAQTDDAALTRAVMRSAETLGAELHCPARFVSAERGRDGYTANYTTPDGQKSYRCRALVNAAGPWVNHVLACVAPPPPRREIDLVQGSHIVVPGRMDHGVYYLEAPRDRRAVFVMPWHENTLVGTTETPYQGDPAAVRPLPGEIDYLKETLEHYFPRHGGDVLDSIAGLRVLERDGTPIFHRPRETVLQCDDLSNPRLVTIYGGKLTGYRATAVEVMRLLARTLPRRAPRADTARLPLA